MDPLLFKPQPPTDEVLLQHYYNIMMAEIEGGMTKAQESEIKGERQAAEHMSGQQAAPGCMCSLDPHTLQQQRLERLQLTPIQYRHLVPTSVCLVCQYEMPSSGEWRMIKGWNKGGGTGIDQIWVKPPQWTPRCGYYPNEIRIIEAKGGEGSDLSSLNTYVGDYGPDGFPLEEGCIQMSREWVYVTCDKLATSADPFSELQFVAALVRDRLAGKSGFPPLTGVTVKNGKPMNWGEMPAPHKLLANQNGTFFYDPTEKVRTDTLRDKLLKLLNDASTQNKDVSDACQPALDALKEAGDENAKLKKYLTDLQKLATDLAANGAALNKADGPLLNHLLNVLQEFKKQVDRKQDLVDLKVEQFLAQYDPYSTNRGNPAWLAQVEAKCEKDTYTQIYKNLNEVSGELLAAQVMMQVPGFLMLKGWSGGGTGIDQVWVRSPGNPAFTLDDLVNQPIPDDLELVIVEAKGGSASLNPNPVYVGESLPNGHVLQNGCKQMDPMWVSVHGAKMVNEASDAPVKKLTGALILKGMQDGKPKVRGLGLSNGTPMNNTDYAHLGVTQANDVGNLPNNLIKYGP